MSLTLTGLSLGGTGLASFAPLSVNASGAMAGNGALASAGNFVSAYLLSGATLTPVAYPGATSTAVSGLNDSGAACGSWFNAPGKRLGFTRSAAGVYTFFSVPAVGGNTDAAATFPTAIASNGTVCGYYQDASGVPHGFALVGESFTAIDGPGATGTFCRGVNASGQVVGWYATAGGPVGFSWQSGTFTTLSLPVAGDTAATLPSGINDSGLIVGSASVFSGANLVARPMFTLSGATYTQYAFTGAQATWANGVSSAGAVVGGYLADDGCVNAFTGS